MHLFLPSRRVTCSVSACMTTEVETGRTKAHAGTDLVPMVLGDKKGEKVFLLLHVEGKESGKDTLQEESEVILKHAILEAEGDAYTRMEGALKELNGLFKGMLFGGAVKDIHAIVGVLEEDGMLHLSHAGRAEAYLIRDGSAAQITEFSRGKPTPSFIHIASGPLQSRDHVILSTQRLLRTVTPAQLSQIVQRGKDILKDIVSELESEKEQSCLLHLGVEGEAPELLPKERNGSKKAFPRGERGRGGKSSMALPTWIRDLSLPSLSSFSLPKLSSKRGNSSGKLSSAKEKVTDFLSDLRDPKRKRRAHLFLLAGAAGVFVIFWVGIQLSLVSSKNQSREELAQLVELITTDLQTAENRQLTGDLDSANAILQRAEDRARQVMDNESGLYRGEALDLLDRIRLAQEDINNIVRIPPRLIVNLSAKNPDIVAQGMMPIGEGEFIVYDKQDMYRVLLNTINDPEKLNTDDLIVDAVAFPRYQTRAFMTTGNSMIEIINGQPTVMKTEDPAGWVTLTDMETYLGYMYALAPEKNQIYKYERLANQYGPAAEYNVNGNLQDAIDMTIDGAVYVLKKGGSIVKLFRGEEQAFTIRNLPEGALNDVTKVVKSSPTGNFYFLDPVSSSVIVVTADSDLGESAYVRQYVLESEQVGTLTDLYVDEDDTRLYVLDEKRLFAIDLQAL